jgi:putative ABC transport system substrate-binding protein
LQEAGFVDGLSVATEIHWAEPGFDRDPAVAANLGVPAIVSSLAQRKAAVIVAAGNRVALAAKMATERIPVLFLVAFDPVAGGIVADLSRPGGNVTGATVFARGLRATRVQMLHTLLPDAATIALFVNPDDPNTESDIRETQAAVSALGLTFRALRISDSRDSAAAFTSLAELRAGVLVNDDAFVAMSRPNPFPPWGKLMSYGANTPEFMRQIGVYAGRILMGEKPADLPVLQPTKFELIIYLRTAKALGLDVPQTLLAKADKVIE